MLELNGEQRKLLAETLRDIANIAAGAMVFGQLLGQQAFSRFLALGGAGVWLTLVACALALVRREKA
jgi:hypothetical protein